MREQHPSFANGEDIRQRTFEFACAVTRFRQRLDEEGGVARMLARQLLACSTSVAGMFQEARAAESDADFISKCSIGLKEANESAIRIRICQACGVGPTVGARALAAEAEAIARIIATIVRNKKRNRQARAGEIRSQSMSPAGR